MTVGSHRDVSNTNYTRVEPLMTVERLKATYLFGVPIIDHEGNEFTDEALQSYIDTAISVLEHDLDLTVKPTKIVEYKDYFANDYYEWGYFQLNRIPVISLESLRIVYLVNDQDQPETLQDIPLSWIRLEKETGLVRMIPNNRFPGRLAVGGGGAFFPELFNRNSMVPSLWEFKYTFGFCDGGVPAIMNAAIGLLAANYALIVAGDLILGQAGIAGTSLSLDGLSQSIQTTASAENNGLSGKIRDNNRQLYGDKTLGATGVIEILRRYYKGQNFSII